ncbi:MAG TPA: hypothetical protein PLG31_12755 [Spirochaetota bacterium]|nr:hypothetical protein [Spirochaetota bacterium]
MNTIHAIRIVGICLLGLAVSCSSIAIDAVDEGGARTRQIDSLFLGAVEVKSDEMTNARESLMRTMGFMLKKRAFRAGTALDAGDRAEQYPFHAALSVFVVKSGDVLEPRTASVAFFRVIDVKSGAAVITIKAASDSCDLAHPGDQAALCATIAERLDAAVKGPAGWFR